MKSVYFLIIALCLFCVVPATAARLVWMNVYIGNSIILQGTTGDHGDEKADVVWKYLLTKRLKETDDFKRMTGELAFAGDRVTLKKSGKVVVVYGGTQNFTEITLVRHKEQNGTTTWSIDPNLVEKWATSRSLPPSL